LRRGGFLGIHFPDFLVVASPNHLEVSIQSRDLLLWFVTQRFFRLVIFKAEVNEVLQVLRHFAEVVGEGAKVRRLILLR
jgi:hypothetical protein